MNRQLSGAIHRQGQGGDGQYHQQRPAKRQARRVGPAKLQTAARRAHHQTKGKPQRHTGQCPQRHGVSQTIEGVGHQPAQQPGRPEPRQCVRRAGAGQPDGGNEDQSPDDQKDEQTRDAEIQRRLQIEVMCVFQHRPGLRRNQRVDEAGYGAEQPDAHAP